MANLSQIFKNGQALQAKAGPLAIALNDILAYGAYPAGLYPIQSTDYGSISAAGTAAVALTTYSSFGASSTSNTYAKSRAVMDTSGNVYIADSYLTGNNGLTVWKYGPTGTLLSSVILDSAAAGTDSRIATLSNGNIVVTWHSYVSPYNQRFVILDANLNTIAGPTIMGTAGANPSANPGLVALSGGGFAYCWASATVGGYIAIYNNAGGVVKAATLIAGITANSGNGNGPGFTLAQLSNNNIAIVVNDTNAANQLQYCIFDTSGNQVVGYTSLASGSGSTSVLNFAYVSVLPGFFCFANSGKCYVVNNAGAVQGSAISVPTTSTNPWAVVNDGTYFYLLAKNSSNFIVTRITTAGATVQTTTPQTITAADAFFDKGGALMVADGTNINAFSISAGGIPAFLFSATFGTLSPSQVIGNLNDFCALGFQQGKFQIVKYMNASIIGISQTAVAAGNAGTLVTINEGPGGYITNEIKGTVGKTYDHSATTVPGNKGVLYVNSVTLKGI